MTTGDWVDYDFAVVRVVPRVDLEAFVNVGIVLHARTREFIGARVVTDPADLARLVPDADQELLSRYLSSYAAIARGDPGHGPMALSPPSERFHWLTAPRSDVIQCSPVHGGRSRDPGATLESLYRRYVSPHA